MYIGGVFAFTDMWVERFQHQWTQWRLQWQFGTAKASCAFVVWASLCSILNAALELPELEQWDERARQWDEGARQWDMAEVMKLSQTKEIKYFPLTIPFYFPYLTRKTMQERCFS